MAAKIPELIFNDLSTNIKRPLGYERVYMPRCKVADTPFHIQGDEKGFHNVIYPISKNK